MKLGRPSAWIGLASLAGVLMLALVDARRAAPGELARVHQRIGDLAGQGGCSQCHGGWFTDMTEACSECHGPIAEQLETGAGLHGVLEPELAAGCATCHDEHHGPEFQLVNAKSFALAGIVERDAFDHARIGWVMDGAHVGPACSTCHANADVPVLAEGAQRFLGTDQDCASCHEDPHEGRMRVSCASCHGQETWDGLHSLGHEERLPLVGGHEDLSCRECHAVDAPHSLEALGEQRSRPAPRACIDCHASPHAEPFVVAAAAEVGQARGAACVSCHLAEHLTFQESGPLLTAARHAFSGFALEAPHDTQGCVECHAPEGSDFAARYPARLADRCSQCHADPHGGQFAEGPFSPGDCLACHARLAWEPHEFTLERHARAAFELTGAHAATECRECHLDPPVEEPRTFRGTAGRCEDCHADAHESFFDPFARALPDEPRGECARCHGDERFDQVPEPLFDHGLWTGFELEGAHLQDSCESCHPRASAPDELGRSFGRVAEHFGAFEGCITCHPDPHRGAFDRRTALAAIEGRQDCARCHRASSFRALPWGFDHGGWTGFALFDAHERAACAACHAPLGTSDERGRTADHANGARCIDCHIDPHAGQFQVGASTDCARCHASHAADFLVFDHERDARFALGEAHAAVACAECHPSTVTGERELVQYRPLPTECVDCHGVHEEVLLRKKRVRR